MNLILGEKQLDQIYEIMKDNLIGIGVRSSLLIDTAGNIIASIDNGSSSIDLYSLAALAAANFGAMSSMAQIVGDDGFSLLFHKGQKENIYFTKIGEDFIWINIFSNKISLGYLRLKMTEIKKDVLSILRSGN